MFIATVRASGVGTGQPIMDKKRKALSVNRKSTQANLASPMATTHLLLWANDLVMESVRIL